MSKSAGYPIHRAVFEGQLRDGIELSCECRDELVNNIDSQDVHGNTALSLAAILGNYDAIDFLLKRGAVVKINNKLKSNALEEAISFGNRKNILRIFEASEEQFGRSSQLKEKRFKSAVGYLPDVDIRLSWDFRTWIPLMSGFLPSDVCRIRKKGRKFRIDTTMPCFDSLTAFALKRRGNVSFLVDVSSTDGPIISTIVDHDRKIFHVWKEEESTDESYEIDEAQVDTFMASTICALRVDLSQAQIREISGGIFGRYPKLVEVGGKVCNCLSLNLGLSFSAAVVVYKKDNARSEHLSANTLVIRDQYRKKMEKHIKDGTFNYDDLTVSERIPDNPTLIDKHANFDDYLGATDYFEVLGRELKVKELARLISLEFATTRESEISVTDFTGLLEAFVSLKQFKRLRDFMELIATHGFPMRIEIPIVATIRACVNFDEIRVTSNTDDCIFDVPPQYKEIVHFKKMF